MFPLDEEDISSVNPTNPVGSAQVWSNAQILSQLDSGQRWNGASITFGFPNLASQIFGGDGERVGFLALNTMQQETARLAIGTWSDLIAPALVEQTTDLTDIAFGLTNTGIEYAHAYYPTDGDVWFNRDDADLNNPVTGSYGFNTYTHEIGHALGLNHMGDYNGAQVDQPSCWQDSSVYSIMSYFGPSNSSGGEGLVAWADWVGSDGIAYSPQTPMLNDVMAIQAIYGANQSTRIGNTTYGFNSNVTGEMASILDFSINAHPILTIYDAGGVNTLDLSGYDTPSIIDLKSGFFTSCNAMTNNVAIDYNTIIQNAVGGSGDDVISGNAQNNRIFGGRGQDTANYLGSATEYKLCFDTDGLSIRDTIQGRDGTDTLNSIERLEFSGLTDTINYKAGGSGLTYANFVGQISDYSTWLGTAGIGVIDSVANRDNIHLLTNVERLSFSDLSLAFDTDGVAGKAYRLYKATFDRPPDDNGIGFWIKEMDAGKALLQVADFFANSPEFIRLYGANTSDADFLKLVYNHALHRDPDQAGYDFWLSDMGKGVSRAYILEHFSESGENVSHVADLIAQGIQYEDWA